MSGMGKTVVLNEHTRRFLKFSQSYLRFVEGPMGGKPLTWEPWQIEIINEILSRNLDTGKRNYSTAYVQLAKGNNKSTMGAALAIWFLVTESQTNAKFQVYAIAASRDQAKVVFDNAKLMVEASPYLLDWIEVTRDALYMPSTKASFRVLSSDAPKTHGKRPSVVICDELHAHENGDLFEAMLTAMITADDGLLVTITNAGADENNSKCGEEYRRGKGGEDKSMYFYAPTVADEDLHKPEKWKIANPLSIITVEKLLAQQKRMPSFRFERWHLNRWTRGVKEWLPKGSWDLLAGDAELIEGATTIIGVDMAKRYDSAAIVIIQPRDGKYVCVCETWAVWNNPDKQPPNTHHVINDEQSIPFDLIWDRIRELAKLYNVVEIPYDPWRIPDAVSESLEAEGLPMVRFDQNLVRMAPASQGLFNAVTEHQIVHGADEKFTAQIQASVAKDYGDRGWKLVKNDAANFMDAAIALVMALDRSREWMESGTMFEVRYV